MKKPQYSNRRIIHSDFISIKKDNIDYCPNTIISEKKNTKNKKNRTTKHKTTLVGIYGIFCDKNNSFYIGQSHNIEGRIKNHKSLLKSNSHSIKSMQNDFNIFGDFRFETLEHCKEEYLLISETYYIDFYIKDGKNSYNTILDTANYTEILHINKLYKKTFNRLLGFIEDNKITIEQINNMLDSCS